MGVRACDGGGVCLAVQQFGGGSLSAGDLAGAHFTGLERKETNDQMTVIMVTILQERHMGDEF